MLPKDLIRNQLTVLRVFLAAILLLVVLLYFGAGGLGLTLLFALTLVLAAVLLVRGIRAAARSTIWRLRNRLIVTYLFIAVVPVVLILVLVGLGVYVVAGQMAVYLVQSELDRRVGALAGPIHFFEHSKPEQYNTFAAQIQPYLRDRFPSVEFLVTGDHPYRYPPASQLTPPPTNWGDYSGLVIRKGYFYACSHLKTKTIDVIMLAPVTLDMLSDLIPNLGDVRLLNLTEHAVQRGVPRDRVPPEQFRLDLPVTWLTRLAVADWNQPSRTEQVYMTITTRPSAVLATVFGQGFEIGEAVQGLLIGVAILFFIVELIAILIGVQLTRSITGTVERLYDGTQRVSQGDVTHRIPVKGSDQLGELGQSFNSMTEHLERLMVIEKEKERLQSELEIAREVQAQLFPRLSPELRSLQLTGVCQPARMVSGDYYDYLCVGDRSLAFAIGDVAGKGISAALLMASIQSIMRTQLSSSAFAMVAAADGRPRAVFSTAPLVSQLNKQLFANTSPEKYATFCFGIYDDVRRTLTYTNAGHLPPVLIRGGEAILLEVTGTVVGAFPDCLYEEKTITLEPGDLLVNYTDGITEPENEYGEEFGVDRLIALLLRHQHAPPEEMIELVMDAVKQWHNAPELPDDMTLLLARRT